MPTLAPRLSTTRILQIYIVANRPTGHGHQQWLVERPSSSDGKSQNAGDIVQCKEGRNGKRASRNEHKDDGIDEHALHPTREACVSVRV